MAHGTGQWIIGVDVGGTKIAAAAVDPVSGEVALRRETATPLAEGDAAVMAAIVSLVEAVASGVSKPDQLISGVGIGVPELVDDRGAIQSAYLCDWSTWNDGDLPGARGPVRFESDVRAAALAESCFGAGQPYPLMLYVSVGTGISSTLVQEGVPLAGARGAALVLSSAPVSVPCTACGAWSEFVLEDYASGIGLARRFAAVSGREVASARQVVAAAEAGDQQALAVVDSAAIALGGALGWLVNVLDPHGVVVGGGLGLSGGHYWHGLVHATRTHVWNTAARDLPILPAALGADAGLIGAALTISSRLVASPELPRSSFAIRHDAERR